MNDFDSDSPRVLPMDSVSITQRDQHSSVISIRFIDELTLRALSPVG